jgi:hypothetical protein
VWLVACAGPVERDGERWRARGGSVGDLAALEPGWRRAPRAALLAFEHDTGARVGWVHQCRGASGPPRAEAYALLVRLEGVEVKGEEPVEIAGRAAWAVVASAVEGGRRVTVKAVTRVAANACTDDFVLVAGDDFADREPAFDRWWTSFAEPAAG